MAGFPIATSMNIVATTLERYLTKDGRDNWINEVTGHSYFFRRLLKRCKEEAKSGSVVRGTSDLVGSGGGQWLHPGGIMRLDGVQAPYHSLSPRRYWYKGWFLSEPEIQANSGPEQIIKLVEFAKEQVMTGCANEFEATLFEPTGNFDHYADGPDAVKVQGIKYAITYDGLAPDGTNSVFGINASTLPNWRNQFITPLGSSDQFSRIGNRSFAIRSTQEVRMAMQRMTDMCKFKSPDGYASIKHVPKMMDNPDRDEYWILMDFYTYTNFGELLFDRRDDVGSEQYYGRRTFSGIPIEFSEYLGIGSNGVYRDEDGNELFAAGARAAGTGLSAFASGDWANTGEIYFLNLKTYRIWVDPDYAPGFIGPFRPDSQHGVGQHVTWWWNTLALSRKRQGVIAGFSNDLVA